MSELWTSQASHGNQIETYRIRRGGAGAALDGTAAGGAISLRTMTSIGRVSASPCDSSVSFGRRLGLSVVLGVLGGAMTLRESAMAGGWPRDFGQIWFAARTVLDGRNPYLVIGPEGQFEWGASLMYPLPAAFIGVPFALLTEPAASALFSALGAGCLAWALMRYGYGPLFGFFSMAVREAVGAAQWSMLLAASLVLWPLSVLLVAKPTVGLALFVARPRRVAIWGALALSALAFLLEPTWIADWLRAVSEYSESVAPIEPYRPIIAFPGGVLALLCILRWRRPEARLVAVLACVPLNLVAYELVPLLLVPRTFWQAAVLVGLSYARHYLTPVLMSDGSLWELQAITGQLFAVLLYLPATVMILRRPNVGACPRWVERAIARWPLWLRGASLMSADELVDLSPDRAELGEKKPLS